MVIQKPNNAIAIEIVSLRSQDGDLVIQIEELEKRRLAIASVIFELKPHSEWVDVIEEPPAPEVPIL